MSRQPRPPIVAVLTIAAVIGTSALLAASAGFKDVPADHPSRAAIDYVTDPQRNWFLGYGDGTFRPDDRITATQVAAVVNRIIPSGMTRAEFAEFLHRANEGHIITPARVYTGNGDEVRRIHLNEGLYILRLYAFGQGGNTDTWPDVTLRGVTGSGYAFLTSDLVRDGGPAEAEKILDIRGSGLFLMQVNEDGQWQVEFEPA